FAFCFHLGPLIAAQPKNPELYFYRGVTLAEMEQYDRAGTDLDRAVALRPLQMEWLALRALVRLGAGDVTTYRAVCAVFLAPANLGQNIPKEAVILMAALAPDVVKAPADLVRRAEKILQGASDEYVALLAYGAALYRAGDWARAADQLRKAQDVHGQGGAAFDWLFLAMAHHRSGQTQEARRLLDRVRRAFDSPTSDPAWDFPGYNGPDWALRLGCRILFREAKALIEPGPAETKK